MIIKCLIFTHYSTKTHFLLDKSLRFFVIKFQSHDSEHDHGLLRIKYAPIYEINTNEKMIFWGINTFHVMFRYCQLHYKMYNNVNTFKYVRKINQVVYKFHYPLPPMNTTKILQPL